MSLLYKKLIKIKSQSIFEKNAIITSDESKINYQALIQKINFLSNNIKNTTKANNFLILLENSIEAIILIFAISKNNGGTVILDYDIKKDQIVKIIKDTNCFNLITDLSKKKYLAYIN
jgi:acyl-coenzyme A synthetase/AMP-(fatty) acid ligase